MADPGGRPRAEAPTWLAIAGLVATLGCSEDATRVAPPWSPDYPAARRVDAGDTIHGVEVPDPYRWLEAEESDETRQWAQAQHALAVDYATGHPDYERFRTRLLELQRTRVYYAPAHRAGRIFFRETVPGSAGRGPLLVVDSSGGKPRVLIDPRRIDPQGGTRLAGYAPDPQGLRVAYGVQVEGKRLQSWRVRDVAAGEDLPDVVSGLTSPVVWTTDGAGFFYTEFPPTGVEAAYTHSRVRYHRLGAAEDATVFEGLDDPRSFAAPAVADDGRHLVIVATDPARDNFNRVWVAELGAGLPAETAGGRLRPVIEQSDAVYTYVGCRDGRLWLLTQLDAPRGRLIEIDLTRPGRESWKTLIAESKATLGGVLVAGDKFLAVLVQDARQIARLYGLDGTPLADVDLPAVGGVTIAGAPGDPVAFVRVNGFSDPGSIYRVDLESGKTELLHRSRADWEPDAFVTRQVFYTSADGTRVPMYLAHRRGAQPDGSARALVYGYGAWGWAAFPWYQPHVHLWLEEGGVYALPNIRGGGEYGRAWHAAGIKLNKRNSLDDFIAAAEWLVDNGWSAPGEVVANGGSASGLLAGAMVTQRPELFGAVTIDHPALDLIRGERYPGGHLRVPEYGSVENEDEFRALLSYSPYHTVDPDVCYPPVLVTVGEKDAVTVPAHGFKFVAALQHAQSCAEHPVLLQVVAGGGHYVFGNSAEQRAETLARQLAFLARALP